MSLMLSNLRLWTPLRTPAHLTAGKTNLYREIANPLKSNEWRQPGFVSLVNKLAVSAGPHTPLVFTVPKTYVPKQGRNRWEMEADIQEMLHLFDWNHDFFFSKDELHALLTKLQSNITREETTVIYADLHERFDADANGQISLDELAFYWLSEGTMALQTLPPAKAVTALKTADTQLTPVSPMGPDSIPKATHTKATPPSSRRIGTTHRLDA